MRFQSRRSICEHLDARLCLAFGDLDPSFSGVGRFEDSFVSVDRGEFAYALVDNSDGSQLLLESIGSGSGNALGLSKLDSSGDLSQDFGLGGMVSWFDPDHAEGLVDAFRLSSGDLVFRTQARHNASFVAFTEAGQLQTSFGTDGLLRLGAGIRWASLAHPAGGFFLLSQENLTTMLSKFTNQGVLDNSFGIAGVVSLPAIFQPQISVDATGGILVYGSRSSGATYYNVVVRLTAEGSPDASFGQSGTSQAETPTFLERMHMSPQGDAFYLVSYSDATADRMYLVRRFTVDMQPDLNYGDAGRASFAVPKGSYSLNMFVHPTTDGHLLIEQSWRETKGSRIVIAQLTSAGELDVSFGQSGLVQHAYPLDIFTYNFQQDAAGNLYWLGTHYPQATANSKTDELIVRFTADGVWDQQWANNGYRAADRHVPSVLIDELALVSNQPNSMLVASGWRGLESFAAGTGNLHQLDPHGSVTFSGDFGSSDARRPAIAPAPNAGWYTGVRAGNGPANYRVELRRYTAGGSQDLNFGDNGILSIATGRTEELLLRSDQTGALTVVAGDTNRSSDPNTSLGVAVIARLTAEGRLDSAFADTGILRLYEKPDTILDAMVSSALGVVLVYRNSILQAFNFRGQPLVGFGPGNAGIASPPGLGDEWVTGQIDEQGRIVGVVRLYYSDSTQAYEMVQIDSQGALITSFGSEGKVALPWEWNVAHDSPQLALRSGTIALANAHGRHAALIRVLAFDYTGQMLSEIGSDVIRDHDLAAHGESVTDLVFAEDGSLWLSVKERLGFDEVGAVYRLFGSNRGRMHNWYNGLDVNRDGQVTPVDALLIVNQLNSQRWIPTTFPDTSNDNLVTPLDVLLVVNYLNQYGGGAAEGEAHWMSIDFSWLFEDDERERKGR